MNCLIKKRPYKTDKSHILSGKNSVNIRALYNNYVKVLFLAALNLNLIKIPICWIISNFYSNKLEQYLICGTVVQRE